ncbi:MAG: hypothetical protein PHQ40_02140 [Anaerolineaceae bacterium]|nr:hypothetical protein [Anaerolineaceae bacterium]
MTLRCTTDDRKARSDILFGRLDIAEVEEDEQTLALSPEPVLQSSLRLRQRTLEQLVKVAFHARYLRGNLVWGELLRLVMQGDALFKSA